jgi:hypothetical protein
VAVNKKKDNKKMGAIDQQLTINCHRLVANRFHQLQTPAGANRRSLTPKPTKKFPQSALNSFSGASWSLPPFQPWDKSRSGDFRLS